MMHLITLVLVLLVLHVDSFISTDTSGDDVSCNDSDISSLEQARNLHPPIPKSTKYAGKSALVYCFII